MWKQVDQVTALQVFFDVELHDLGNAIPSQARLQVSLRVIHDEASLHGDGDDLLALMKFPGERMPGCGVPEKKALMVLCFQLLRSSGPPTFRQISPRCASQDPVLEQPLGN